MKQLTGCVALLVGLLGVEAPAARADFINFSSPLIQGVEAPIPNGYAGFTWNNFSALNTQTDVTVMPSGYKPANTDSASPYVAFNLYGDPASLSRSTPFAFVGGFFTAAWRDGLQVEAKGLRNGTVLYDTTFVLSATQPTFELLNYQGIDTLQFTSSGGTPHGYAPPGLDHHPPLTQFAMDDLLFTAEDQVLSINSVVAAPEPSSFLLLALGATIIAGWQRRRRAAPG